MKLHILSIAALLSACTYVTMPPETDGGGDTTTTKQQSSCDCYDECEAYGYACADAATCACGDYLDPQCANGASNLCSCLYSEQAYQCTGDDWIAYYVTCYQWTDHPDAETIMCFSAYSVDQCDAAVAACFQ